MTSPTPGRATPLNSMGLQSLSPIGSQPVVVNATGGGRPAAAMKPRAAAENQSDEQLWKAILQKLREMFPALCRAWFDDIEVVGVESGTLVLRAQTAAHQRYLSRECNTQFTEAAMAVTGRLIAAKFISADGHAPMAAPAAPSATAAANLVTRALPTGGEAAGLHGGTGGIGGGAGGAGGAGNAAALTPETLATEIAGVAVAQSAEPWTGDMYEDGLILNPDCVFENFVVGPENRLAHAAAMEVASLPGAAYNPLFIHGGVGLGKTHLLQAICLQIRSVKPDAVIYYTSCEGFMTEFFDAVQAGHMTRFRHKFRHVDVLVVDDIHYLAKRERTQEEFFHTFNALYHARKQIILSSDAAPDEIPQLEDRLVSRFQSGLVAKMDPPSFETRVEILKCKARIRGVELPTEVATLVAGQIDSNIRELEGAITKLQMTSIVERRPIDLAMARQAIGEPDARVEPKIQMQTIINVITEYFGVKTTDLQGKRRHRSVAQPRQICMYLARRHTHYSLEEIGGHFGGRDHTTVMHAVRTVSNRCETDESFGQMIKGLEDRLKL